MEKLLRSYPGFSADQIPPLMEHMREDHLTGEQIGEIAAAAGVKKVILTHFAPGNDGETDVESYAPGLSRHSHAALAHPRPPAQPSPGRPPRRAPLPPHPPIPPAPPPPQT